MINQEYTPLSEIGKNMRAVYVAKLAAAISKKDSKSSAIYKSMLAVIDPVAYKHYVDKKIKSRK